MKKGIIFGAGYMGKGAYFKLKPYYDIVAYADNNGRLQGGSLNGVEIVEPERLKRMQKELPADIMICSDSYGEMAAQLEAMGIEEFYVMAAGFVFRNSAGSQMEPVRLGEIGYYKKQRPEEESILFVQNAACIRTNKLAMLVKNAGFSVSLLYTVAPPDVYNQEFAGVFDHIYTVFTMEQLIDFVNNSEFDIIHSSNEPDYLTNLLQCTNKKIVHDTHDLVSLRPRVSIDALVAEYLANRNSDGLLYVSEGIREIANQKYHIAGKNTLAMENWMVQSIQAREKKAKLSSGDGQIHCVYEGGISADRPSHRWFEDMWEKLAGEGIHIHYYSQQNLDYCRKLETRSKYLHYEGNRSSTELVEEMTKYDCGLAVFNVTRANKLHLEHTSINKIYEYLNAGLPVAVNSLRARSEFVKRYGAGMEIDFSKPLYPQFEQLISIKISNTFLQKNHLLMEDHIDGLLQFYRRTAGTEMKTEQQEEL